MWKYEDFKGTVSELINILQEEYQLMFYPATSLEYAGIVAYAKEATKDEIKDFDRWLIAVSYEGNEIIEIDSNIWIPEYNDDEDEKDEDDSEFWDIFYNR